LVRSTHRIFVGKDVHKFSCAHMTVFPDGTKERLHGHNFQVSVAFDLRDISLAAFFDFAVIKRALADQCAAWGERLLLPERSPALRIVGRGERDLEFTLCGKRYVIPTDEVLLLPLENVVVELLAAEFARQLVSRLGGDLRKDVCAGMELTVTESAGQGGICYLTF
jgi:6-pyruvoyltetrahydropterin/6-carboxytetrahydropterin synthase